LRRFVVVFEQKKALLAFMYHLLVGVSGGKYLLSLPGKMMEK